MQLVRALLSRFAFGIASLLFISVITFVASDLAPGDPATYIAGEKASPETIQRIRESLGLDKPLPMRYVNYIGGIVKGDWGESYSGTHEKVSAILGRTMPMTLRLALLAILLASVMGISMGTIAAIKETKLLDRGILSASTFGVTLPNFVLAPILTFIFCIKFDVLPTTWETELRGPLWMYLALPVIVLSLRPMSLLTRLTRASMIETLRQEFVRTATAQGVPPFRLMTKYALRNAILPVVTAIGTTFGFLLTGSFVVERYFSYPGIGSTTIEAILSNNVPVIQACVLVTGFIFIVVNLIVDILLPILDPRIREGQI